MCTLVVAVGAFSDVALWVAANRDESLDRPASPPALRTDRPLAVVAPLDERAGGTWLGVNQAGMFAGLTNRFGAPPDPARRSRGWLVFEALEQRDAASAAARMADCDPAATNRFHLLMADPGGAELVFSDGQRIQRRSLGRGIHVLTERSLGAAAGRREGWLQAELARFAGGPAPGQAELLALLTRHDPDDPFDGTCVHADWLGYGTRSSTLIRLSADPAAARLLHAPGPPCQGGYVDLSGLLVDLLAGG